MLEQVEAHEVKERNIARIYRVDHGFARVENHFAGGVFFPDLFQIFVTSVLVVRCTPPGWIRTSVCFHSQLPDSRLFLVALEYAYIFLFGLSCSLVPIPVQHKSVVLYF